MRKTLKAGKLTHVGLEAQKRESMTWNGSPQLIVALVVVCLSVFTWGLHYKLSLYRSTEQTCAKMPAAKLLSPKERPPIAVQQAQLLPSWTLAPVVLLPGGNRASIVGLIRLSLLATARPPFPANSLWYMAAINSRPPPAVA
jgi:hypothetical protein